MLKDFKAFIARGNALDLAVGVIIGAAFGAIVNSLVKDVLMPPIGKLIGGLDFANKFVSLSGGSYQTLAEAQAAGALTLNYGLFINAVVNFLILAFVVFLIVRQVNRFRSPAHLTTKECPYCTSAIPLKANRCPQCTATLTQPGGDNSSQT